MFQGMKMPKLSDTSDDYKIIRIRIKVGDEVKKGDIIMDVETDKATMDVASYYDGKITELNVKEGSIVRYDSLMGVINTPD